MLFASTYLGLKLTGHIYMFYGISFDLLHILHSGFNYALRAMGWLYLACYADFLRVLGNFAMNLRVA
jgi:hypothetical protein